MPHRYFIEGPLNEGETITLSKEELGHLKKVMRTKPGTIIEIINGKGTLAKAPYFEEIQIEHVENTPPLKFTKSLALGLTEPKILELVIEKGTELGITSFYIFPAKKSKLTGLSPNKRERLHKILISALKQSKRLFLPEIIFLNSIKDLPKEQNYLLADFSGESGTTIEKESYTFIIGPESGFTDKEILYLKENLNAKGILLSDGVLRAETAALCAASLLANLLL